MHGVTVLLMLSAFLLGQSTQPSANLVPNGNFEIAANNPRSVSGWQPLRNGYERILTDTRRKHVVKFSIPAEIARREGFHFFSERFPIEHERIYRCRADIHTSGPHVVLFLNGYANIGGKERRAYRQVKSGKHVKANEWGTLDFQFTPRQPSTMSNKIRRFGQKSKYEIGRLEVEFFIYGSDEGVVQIDNIEIIPVSPDAETRPASRALN